MLVDRTEPVADLTVEEPEHPVFSIWAKQGERRYRSDDHRPLFRGAKRLDSGRPVRRPHVVVRLRNGAPLVVERKFGDGRVMAFLTTAAPKWNNLATTPRHIAAMLQLAAYISAARQTDPGRQVGTPLEVDVDRSKYLSQVKFTTPRGGAAGVFPVEALPPKSEPRRPVRRRRSKSALRRTRRQKPRPSTDAAAAPISRRSEKRNLARRSAGRHCAIRFLRSAIESRDAGTAPPRRRRFAYNVNPEEGNLKMVDGPQLESRLTGVKYHFHHAADAFFDADDPDQANFGRTILYHAHCVADRRATAGLRD